MSAAVDRLAFVCPACRGSVTRTAHAYHCDPCERQFPIVCGIPDFRLAPDPYIGLDADRAKARHLFDAAKTRGFDPLIDYYYSITPDDPPDRAVHWKAHALAEDAIAAALLNDAGFLDDAPASLLDLGCATGGLALAVRRRIPLAAVAGIDVALRWLVVGQVRMREAGVDVALVAANAEHLPFPDAAFDRVTAIDLLEHVDDAEAVLREARRVSSARGRLLATGNNRYAPLPEPQLGIWGVGWMPRARQAAYVARRRPDVNRYRIQLRSARELDRLAAVAGFRRARTEPALLVAPHRGGAALQAALRAYNAVRRWPIIRSALRAAGPRLRTLAET